MATKTRQCSYCAAKRADISNYETDVRQLLRNIEKKPGTPLASGCKTKLVEVKAKIKDARRRMEEHNCGGEN